MTSLHPAPRRHVLLSALAAFICSSALHAQTPIKVFASNGMKAVIVELQPQIEKSIGHPLSIQYGSTTGLKQKIDGGEAFDAAILASDGLDDLVKRGKLNAASRAEFAKSGVGLAVRSGAKKPDISTPDALKKTLKAAASIAYAKDGASAPTISEMFMTLGIASDVQPKLLLTQGSGPAMDSVATGKTEVVMTLVSELKPVKGIDVVGLLPASLNHYVSFGAAANAKASNSAPVAALIKYLKDPAAAPVYKAKGMEQIR